MFLAPVEGPRPNYTWEGNRLVKSDRDSTAAGNELFKLVRIQLREAMSTVIRQKDLDRFANAPEFVRVAVESLQSKLDAELNRTVDQRAQLVDGLAASDSILPIGRTAAKFFLNIDESASTAYLATQIRTTEKHVENGRPSVNGFWIPIAYEGSKQVRVNYRELASPRMEITRIIDLAGFVWGDGARPSHMLVFSYGDWVEIRGANPAVNSLLREHPETMALMERLVRGRLYPSPLQRAEADVMARGKLGAARTLDWIHRSKSWSVAEYAVDMQPWADHVMALAKSVLDENRRRQQQKEAARALISQVFGDKTLADSIVDVGFESLAEHPNMSRSMLVDVLFKTAQKPSQEPEVEAIGTAFALSALPILSSGNLGWDIRPAVAASAKGAP
jgi:Arc/MetJ-type ribon-helix-helix transcriptional regulator